VSVTNSDTTRHQQQVEHLARVRALLKAVESGISAIEKNNLPEFETHLAVQETMCNRLSASGSTLSSTLSLTATAGHDALGETSDTTSEAQLLKEIREAHVALAHLNRVYAALLKRARRSVGIMASLYRQHAPLPQCHTWSCEA
jgi:hypothetical protein